MPRVCFAQVDGATRVASPENSRGSVQTRALFHRTSDPLHLYLHELGPGAVVQVVGEPTDRQLFVWKGGVETGDVVLGPRSSAIVERGAALTIKASNEGASVLQFGLARAKVGRSGGHVHLLPSNQVPRVENAGGRHVRMALHADASCPTCSVWLHENDFSLANEPTAVHSHTEDEIIFISAGAIRLGNQLRGPGTALAIAAGTKYGFASGPEGLSFVNFRAVSPTYISADGSTVLDEAVLWRETVGKPHYLSAASHV